MSPARACAPTLRRWHSPILLCDVGPRDGLQNEPETLPPAIRADLVNRLAAAGLPRVEAVSFVRDDRVPRMAGAEEVVKGITPFDKTAFSGLVLNERGWERFAASGLDRVNVTFGATEAFNQANPEFAHIETPFTIEDFGGWDKAFVDVIERVFREQVQRK